MIIHPKENWVWTGARFNTDTAALCWIVKDIKKEELSYILSSSDVEDDDDEGISADIVLACIKRFIA